MEAGFLVWLIQDEYDRCCQKIAPRDGPYRFPTVCGDDGSEHLEVAEDLYHLVVTERGRELSRFSSPSKEEILYRLVSGFAWGAAVEFEVRNRIEGRDFRRMLFAKQVSYLESVNRAWADRLRREISEILTRHPFDDDESEPDGL
jgi:hypothetical protein